jgi:hypothetical protein
VVAVCSVNAEESSEPSGLLGYMGADVNEAQFMQNFGLKFGGWINAGITYNANDSAGRYNGPVTFNDREAEFQLNQFYLYLQRAVNTEGDAWDFGFRADFMFGTDAVFTQAYGSPNGTWDLGILAQEGERFYDIAFPQVYAEIFAPIGNGLTAKIGHFYTIIGNEVVTAPDNFFYSHAYTMQYGEPFTHTGVLLSYPFDQNWTITAGAVTGSETSGGWDGAWDKGLGNWAGIGGVTWASEDKATSVALTGTTGETSEHDHNQWSIYSVVIKHDLLEGLHYTFQHDHGFADKAIGGQDATWYGINNYLVYDINEELGVGLRGEWFRDDDGVRVASPGRTLTYFPGANSYYAFTAGLNWKPLSWVSIRPNVRYDWNDGPPAFDNGSGVTGYAAKRKDQFLFSTDVVVSF